MAEDWLWRSADAVRWVLCSSPASVARLPLQVTMTEGTPEALSCSLTHRQGRAARRPHPYLCSLLPQRPICTPLSAPSSSSCSSSASWAWHSHSVLLSSSSSSSPKRKLLGEASWCCRDRAFFLFRSKRVGSGACSSLDGSARF